MQVVPIKIPTLIFELGRIMTFHYPTQDEKDKGLLPKEVFWQDIYTKNTYGPFPSIFEAMRHYAFMVAEQQTNRHVGQVLQVDFIQKKKVNFELP